MSAIRISLLALLVASCAGGDDSDPLHSSADIHLNRTFLAENLCKLDRVPQVINVVATQTITGSVIMGDVRNTAELQVPTLFVAFYATRAGSIWYGRHRDVSSLIGIGRAATSEEADNLASDQCENAVDLFRHEDRYHGQMPYSLKCLPVVRTQCF